MKAEPRSRKLLPDFNLHVEMTVKDRQWRTAIPDIRRKIIFWCREALVSQKPKLPGGPLTMSVVLANDRFIRRLNHDFRGKDTATNVLSFPMLEPDRPPGNLEIGAEPAMVGDIILARETIAREALEQGKTVNDHLAHLVLHGCMHLLGHDHETPSDARRMERLEIAILKQWGIANPYLFRA